MRTVNSMTIGLMSLATGLAWLPATAHATEPQIVNVNQTARRMVGQCSYEARLEGHYQLSGTNERGVAVRDALVNVTTRLECRGAQPKLALRQIYFAATTESELLNRIAEATRVDNPGSNGACGFAPAFSREAGILLVTDVVASCEPPRRGAPVAVSARTRRH